MDIEIIKLVSQVAISVGAAFLAASLAAKRFRGDKLWEKKMTAYGELVDALHKMKFSPSEHFDAEIDSRKIDDAYSKELWDEFRQGRRNVLRIAESSSFLLSHEVMEAVEKMESEISKARNLETSGEYLDRQYFSVETCIKEVKLIGSRELRIK